VEFRKWAALVIVKKMPFGFGIAKGIMEYKIAEEAKKGAPSLMRILSEPATADGGNDKLCSLSDALPTAQQTMSPPPQGLQGQQDTASCSPERRQPTAATSNSALKWLGLMLAYLAFLVLLALRRRGLRR